jgi:hypothetical protein
MKTELAIRLWNVNLEVSLASAQYQFLPRPATASARSTPSSGKPPTWDSKSSKPQQQAVCGPA